MKKKDNSISESDFWDSGKFEHKEHVTSADQYDYCFRLGEDRARGYLGQLSGSLTLEDLQKVHGRLFGEVFLSPGEFRKGFDPESFASLEKQGQDAANLSQDERLRLIAEQHVELVEARVFVFGNEQMANLITEWRMEKALGEHPWQGLDRVDAKKWDTAVRRRNAGTVEGLLHYQLQDAIDFEQNPLSKFQQRDREQDPPPKLTRRERKEAKLGEGEKEERLADLEVKATQLREEEPVNSQNGQKEALPIDLSEEKLAELEDARAAQRALEELKKTQERIRKQEQEQEQER